MLTQTLLNPLLYLLLVSPLLLLGRKHKDWQWQILVLFAGYFLFDSLLTVLPTEVDALQFVGGEMNWEGKLFSYFGAFLFFVIFRQFTLEQAGLRLRQDDGSATYGQRNVMVFTVLVLIYGFLIGGYTATLENGLFQLLMPSVVEEIVYRGILLMLLNEVFSKPYRIGQTQFGMGLIITALLFGLWHSLSIEEGGKLYMNWGAFLITGGLGFYLGIVRERTGSLLYPIILHIIINLLPVLIGAVL